MKNMNLLVKEFNWYVAHQPELVEKYNGKHLVIRDEKVAGAYNSSREAIIEAKKDYELGTFMVQLCTPGEEAYTRTFYSPIVLG
jgi:hypothetical protein